MNQVLDVLDPTMALMPGQRLPEGVVAVEPKDAVYHPEQGLRMQHDLRGVSGYTDLVRLSDDFFMLISDTCLQSDFTSSYVASGWVGFHYRLSGRSSLVLGDDDFIEKEAAHCYVSCYPTGFIRTERAFHEDSFRYVAILFKPALLARDFPSFCGGLPAPMRDHLDGRLSSYWQHPVPFTRDVLRCLREIIEIGFVREMRWHFLRGKALELLCRTIGILSEGAAITEPSDIRIRPRDIERLHEARRIIAHNPNARLTIPDIARRIGLNRRKLTYGFSRQFGMTVFEFGQNCRMEQAVRLLREDCLNIGQIAVQLGYENPRNFSVAFVSRFGLLPKDARARMRQGFDLEAGAITPN